MFTIQNVIFPEDSWGLESCDRNDRGMGKFRYYMESVKACDIASQGLQWCAEKYTILTAMVLGKLFSVNFFDEPSHIFSRYMIALEEVLEENEIEFKPFEGITEKGWKKFKSLTGAEV